MTLMVKVRCHWCWRDPGCECGGECDYKAPEIDRHECDCEFCTYEDEEPELIGDCECECHKPVPKGCKRCGDTRFIQYEAIGSKKKGTLNE